MQEQKQGTELTEVHVDTQNTSGTDTLDEKVQIEVREQASRFSKELSSSPLTQTLITNGLTFIFNFILPDPITNTIVAQNVTPVKVKLLTLSVAPIAITLSIYYLFIKKELNEMNTNKDQTLDIIVTLAIAAALYFVMRAFKWLSYQIVIEAQDITKASTDCGWRFKKNFYWVTINPYNNPESTLR